jgi:hypothetical protein
MLDIKEIEILNRIYKNIQDDLFDEDDIFLLYMLIREYADDKSPTKEIANFMAHRTRNKGFTYNNTKIFIDSVAKSEESGHIDLTEFNSYISEAIIESLNNVLEKIGYNPIYTQSDDVCLCVISLLQHTIIFRNGVPQAKLQVYIGKEEICLMLIANNIQYLRMVFLDVPNHYTAEEYKDDFFVDKALRIERIGKIIVLTVDGVQLQ